MRPEIGLSLRCIKCGWCGKHKVRMVLLGAGRLKPDTLGVDGLNDERMAFEQRSIADSLYGLAIPHPVACPNCGAVNFYSVTGRTWLDVLLMGFKYRSSWRVQRRRFKTAVGSVHPLVAAIHYRYLLEQNPGDCLTRLRMANSLRSGGYWEQARVQYGTLLENSSAPVTVRIEAAYNLALLAGCENDSKAMEGFCRRGLDLYRAVKLRGRAVKNPLKFKAMADILHDLLDDLAKPGNLDPDNLLQLLVGVMPE